MKRRGKVELKRIEDKTSRQVSFSKRRSGLFKKARELSVLCDVDIALCVSSNGGRFYEFSSGNNSFSKIIERYWRHADPQNNAQQHVSTAKRYYPVTSTSSDGINVLHPVQRFLEGQIIEQLNFSDLVQLEKQLSASLIQTRKIKEKRLMEELRQQQSMDIHDASYEEQRRTPMRLGLSNSNEEVSFVVGEQMMSANSTQSQQSGGRE